MSSRITARPPPPPPPAPRSPPASKEAPAAQHAKNPAVSKPASPAPHTGSQFESAGVVSPAPKPVPAQGISAPASRGQTASPNAPSAPSTPEGLSTSGVAATAQAPSTVSKDSRFSSDFKSWLQTHGYGDYDFAKGDVPSFGGRAAPGEKLAHDPVIFIHGNSDSAAGWKNSIETFESKGGYKPSEMYAMTWGPQNPLLAGQQAHSRHYEEEVRGFIQAVKEYTGADKVDVIGHSMGVTLARKAIEGGEGYDPYPGGGHYDLGAPLTGSVDTFVGIAGANHGLASALWTGDLVPTTNTSTGLHPMSAFLADINSQSHYEGEHVYSIWSNADELLGVGLGATTAPIPGQDGEKVYSTYPYGHFGSRDLTADEQLSMIRDHKVL